MSHFKAQFPGWSFLKLLAELVFLVGNFDGDEVVQLYIKDEYASVARPIMELKGFHRIHLKKGESKSIKFQQSPDMLTMLDKNLNRTIEPGDFRILIGTSSNDIRLRRTVTVE